MVDFGAGKTVNLTFPGFSPTSRKRALMTSEIKFWSSSSLPGGISFIPAWVRKRPWAFGMKPTNLTEWVPMSKPMVSLAIEYLPLPPTLTLPLGGGREGWG